eukprot:TRINITY_DN74618_c0_g1_i1.p1 TRINITY_DN74618_c0_g1~~TRINITY_DN74618_c0_g1_i1.p1  ORF type:complete len:566 (+),score=74.57 TRINITY_DN74618_c0_g1_i1:31-1698(+)
MSSSLAVEAEEQEPATPPTSPPGPPPHWGSDVSRQSQGNPRTSWIDNIDAIRTLHAPVRLRKDVSGHHFNEHWLELLNDLILVAFFSNLGHVLVGGGPYFSNIWMVMQLFSCVVDSTFFVSFYTNICVIDDALSLFLLLVVTSGSCLMADATYLAEHYPCFSPFGIKANDYVDEFYIGLCISSVGRFVMQLRLAYSRNTFAFWVAAALFGVCCLIAVLAVVLSGGLRIHVFGPAPEHWNFKGENTLIVTSITFLSVGRIIVIILDPAVVGLLNTSHFHNRWGILVLISLGEWVIQVVCSRISIWDLDFVFSQLFLCFGIALQYFNTRPHSISEDGLKKNPAKACALVFMHFILAFFLFFTGSSIDVAIEDMKLSLQAKKSALHDHHDEHHCTLGHVHWPGNGSVALACGITGVQIIIVTLRSYWKFLSQDQGPVDSILELEFGRKFALRQALSLCHIFVPLALELVSLDAVLDRQMIEVQLWFHAALMLPQLALDSVFRIQRRSTVDGRMVRGRTEGQRHNRRHLEMTAVALMVANSLQAHRGQTPSEQAHVLCP